MLGDNQNPKDTSENSVKDNFSIYKKSTDVASSSPLLIDNHKAPYGKTNKLITALYMVTDTMDRDEPIRLKLRTLGSEILLDMTILRRSVLGSLNDRVNAIMSFLNIARDMAMISEMNCNILMKEFTELKDSIRLFQTQKKDWLEEFMSAPQTDLYGQEEDKAKEREENMSYKTFTFHKGHPISNGHNDEKGQGTRLGVHKADTLLRALNNINKSNVLNSDLKDKRRNEILSIIKDKQNSPGFDGLNVSDIKSSAVGILKQTGDKTLQRELVSMISQGILRKTGSKRWSRYFLS